MARKTKSADKDLKSTPAPGEGGDAKAGAIATRKARPAAARKSTKKATPGKTPKVPLAVKTNATEPTDEEIRLRAYFISERRQRLALPGDSSSDWLEAIRQLSSGAQSP